MKLDSVMRRKELELLVGMDMNSIVIKLIQSE